MKRGTLSRAGRRLLLAIAMVSVGCGGARTQTTSESTEVKRCQVKGESEAEQAEEAVATARAFFSGCEKYDWEMVRGVAFESWKKPEVKNYIMHRYGGLKIVAIGEAVREAPYPGFFVPYHVVTTDGKQRKHRLAVRADGPSHRWRLDGGY